MVAKLLGALESHGEARVQPLLEATLAQQQRVTLPPTTDVPAAITVPEALAEFVIEAGKATDYDHLLVAAGGTHE